MTATPHAGDGPDADHVHAVVNLLEDLDTQEQRLESTERAMLGLVENAEAERSRTLPDSDARRIFHETQSRIQSIALVHEKLYRSADLSHVDFGEHLGVLIDNLFRTYDAETRGISRSLVAVGVRLPINVAVPCGLIVNELVTNALRHAFSGRPSGKVTVALDEGPGQLTLTVTDDGIGIPESLDLANTGSLGLDLVFSFADQLNAQVEVVRARGTSFRFQVPR